MGMSMEKRPKGMSVRGECLGKRPGDVQGETSRIKCTAGETSKGECTAGMSRGTSEGIIA